MKNQLKCLDKNNSPVARVQGKATSVLNGTFPIQMIQYILNAADCFLRTLYGV